MKKFLTYMLLAGFALLTAACAKNDADEMMPTPGGDDRGCVKLSIAVPADTRAEVYDALSRSTLRIYKVAAGKSELIRKYYPATTIPADIFLIAGEYKVTVDAGDKSEATFTRKSYYGEHSFTLLPHETQLFEIKCKITNIAVRVVYDRTILEKFDKSHIAYVSAADAFSKTEAINNSVPSLTYTKDTTGFFLLPQGVKNLSWGFYGEGTVLGKKEQTGVIPNPVGGTQYTLTFKYSKTPDGALSVTINTREYEEKYDDGFIFSPQPTLSGLGFNIDQVVPFHTEPVKFSLTSIDAISTAEVTANGVKYPILTTGGTLDPTAAANGISYTAIDAFSGTIAFNNTFFAKLPGGIQDLAFLMKDAGNTEGKGTAHVAVQGLVTLAASDYDLWTNTGTFKTIVTDPAITSVKISYRIATTGTWHEVIATKGADYTYTAQIEPTWTTVTNAEAQTVYTIDNTTGLWANGSYDYKATIGTTESAAKTITLPAGDALPTLNNSGLSCYTSSNAGATFWGSGNNFAAKSLCTFDSGIGGAKVAAKNAMGVMAPGNLFSGTFNMSGSNGAVSFGVKYDYTARPSALTIHYKATIGNVDANKHATKIPLGQPDKASIYAVIVDWSARHDVASGLEAPTGIWSPTNGMNSVSEGKIIGYAMITPTGTTSTMTTVDAPFYYYDKTARPTPGKYSLVLSCSTSLFGDYLNGCSSNVMYIKDFHWKY